MKNIFKKLFLSLLVLAFALGWLLWGSPWLRVTQIEVTGASEATTRAVAEVAEESVGTPMVSVASADVAAQISALIAVQSAQVRKSWPQTLVVEVVERRPSGFVLAADGKFDVLGSDARSMANVGERPADLPELRAQGEDLTSLAQAMSANTPEVLARIESASMTGGVIELQLRDGAGTVRWGAATASDVKARTLAVLMLSAPDARWFDLSAAGAPVTAPERPSRLGQPSPSPSGTPSPGASGSQAIPETVVPDTGTASTPVEPAPGSGGELPAQLTTP